MSSAFKSIRGRRLLWEAFEQPKKTTRYWRRVVWTSLSIEIAFRKVSFMNAFPRKYLILFALLVVVLMTSLLAALLGYGKLKIATHERQKKWKNIRLRF